MNQRLVTVFSVLVIVQIFGREAVQGQQTPPKQDPKLMSCAKKIFNQASKVKFNKLPECFEAHKLDEAKGHLEVVSKFLKQLPPQCRRPNKDNITKCLQTTEQLLKKDSPSLQAAVVKGANAVIDGAQGCIESLMAKFTNLDKWVLAGCP